MDESNIEKFYSSDKKEFSLLLKELNLKSEYIEQIKQNGFFDHSEDILEFGIDYKLDPMDSMRITNKLMEIKEGCYGPEEFTRKKKFDLSKHVKEKSTEVLKDRGFSTKHSDLIKEIASIIFFTNKIEKAKIRFGEDFNSISDISYTISAELASGTGKIAISFKKSFLTLDQEEFILVVTILSFE